MISQTLNWDNGFSTKSTSIICYELINLDELEVLDKLAFFFSLWFFFFSTRYHSKIEFLMDLLIYDLIKESLISYTTFVDFFIVEFFFVVFDHGIS